MCYNEVVLYINPKTKDYFFIDLYYHFTAGCNSLALEFFLSFLFNALAIIDKFSKKNNVRHCNY